MPVRIWIWPEPLVALGRTRVRRAGSGYENDSNSGYLLYFGARAQFSFCLQYIYPFIIFSLTPFIIVLRNILARRVYIVKCNIIWR
jgi:hypothetical protein